MPHPGDDDKQKVLAASDIVAVIGEQLALKPKGREFAALCPFHDDHNPSMAVVPAKQIYHCFVCGAGGDVFSFVMRYHKLSFPEALKHLAERSGIELTGRREPRDPNQASLRKRIAEANELALRFFRHRFNDEQTGKIARDYALHRGITPEMIERFELGYAPDAWDQLANAVEQKKLDREAFIAAGLIAKRDRGNGHFDRLRHRLVFPISDALGRPVAFGGRRLREEDNPKYWNSPETELFHKSATLFGLHHAKRAIISTKTAVIVEGYTDVIAAHQVERENVVATLGTALTPEHVRELRRFAERIVLVFDGDVAGRKAADRAVEAFLTEEVDTAVAILPGGQDPADLLATPEGLETWDQLISHAPDALAFGLDRMAEDAGQAQTLTGRQKVGEAYAAKLLRLGLDRASGTRRALLLDHIGKVLGLDSAATERLIAEARAGNNRQQVRDKQGNPEDLEAFAEQSAKRLDHGFSSRTLNLVLAAERQVIACLIRHNELFTKALDQGWAIDESFMPADPVGPVNQKLYATVYEALASGQSVTLEELLTRSAETEDYELAALLAQLGRDIQDLGLDDPQLAERELANAYRSWLAASPAGSHAAEEERSSDDQKLRDTLERLRSTVTPGRIGGRNHRAG
ncbi:DNA primase [Mucisphaera calidilacus]|uniref:DNA primase n=1 Tax=Mucisphaera calidilacus TaxID=2527982 RepID=A0A518BZ16_9BACT|nr:DNA primase [Mucisphaera calidilacus]QDU72217.1 DNA primase [Mucisphaera calidilacus]